MAHHDISDPSFPKRLTRLRKRAGLSKAQLAERADVHERTIHNWERGAQKRVLEGSLERVAAALGVSPEHLLHGEPAPASTPAPRRRGRVTSFAVAAGVVAVVGIVSFAGLRRNGHPHGAPAPDSTRGVVAAPVTTTSVLAYRDYVTGCENLKRLYREEARVAFRRAVARDSTFAMAWAMLAHPELRTTKEEYQSYARKAEALSENCTEREQLMIEALARWTCDDVPGCMARLEELVERYPDEAEGYRLLAGHYWGRRECARAVACLQAAVVADPTDGLSHNRLAYHQAMMGDVEGALASARRYRKLSPWEANPYDTMGDILRRAGRWDDAMASYREALARKHDFAPSLQSLGHMYVMMGKWNEAEALFAREMEVADADARSRGRLFAACVPAHRGQFKEALARLDTAMEADRREHFTGSPYLEKLRVAALVRWETGDQDGALALWETLLTTARTQGMEEVDRWTGDYVMMMAQRDPDAAARYVEMACKHLEGAAPQSDYIGLVARGWLALSRGDADAAREYLERAREHDAFFSVLYPLALACERTGKREEAVEVLQEAFRCYSDQIFYGPWVGESRYHLAMDLEALGRLDESRAELERLVALWDEADDGYETLERARKALGLADVDEDVANGR